MKKNLTLKALAVTSAICIFMTGCGKKDNPTPNESTNNLTSSATVTTAPNTTPTAGNDVTPAITDTPEATPTPVPEWEYKIVQQGYYNACAGFDEDGNLLSYAPVTEGELVYYNDFDEYYDNFIFYGNYYNKAELILSDDIRHSGDNAIKVTSRGTSTFGFAGFALLLDGNNGLDFSPAPKCTVNMDYWTYFTDDFNTGVTGKQKYAIWANCSDGTNTIAVDVAVADLAAEVATLQSSIDNATKDEAGNLSVDKAAIEEQIKAVNAKIGDIQSEFDAAEKQGFKCLAIYEMDFETWTNVNQNIVLDLTTPEGQEPVAPMIAISSIGEDNADNITFYNPYYVDDLSIKILSINN